MSWRAVTSPPHRAWPGAGRPGAAPRSTSFRPRSASVTPGICRGAPPWSSASWAGWPACCSASPARPGQRRGAR
jgi:hypothetical protein